MAASINVVRGSVTFRQGPFVWWEHLLEGGDLPTWFAVEYDDGRLGLVMWVTRKDLTLRSGDPYVVDGITFRETERGKALLHHPWSSRCCGTRASRSRRCWA